MAEAFLPFPSGDLLPASPMAQLMAGMVIGIGVGLVSSMLGVAGGELLIPALVLIFGADIKTAGSASILISLGIVGVGLWRYLRAGRLPESAARRRAARRCRKDDDTQARPLTCYRQGEGLLNLAQQCEAMA